MHWCLKPSNNKSDVPINNLLVEIFIELLNYLVVNGNLCGKMLMRILKLKLNEKPAGIGYGYSLIEKEIVLCFMIPRLCILIVGHVFYQTFFFENCQTKAAKFRH